MSLPIGMYRRAFSYDDALEDPTPMTPPPSDVGNVPWRPVIPERKYQHLAKVLDPADRVGQTQPLVCPRSSGSSVAPATCTLGCHGSLYVFSVPQLELGGLCFSF